jgi:geranylgeranyl pyrophosphate synthase
MVMPLRTPLGIESFDAMIDQVLRDATTHIEPPLLRTVLDEAIAGGKRLRPKLIALACEAAGGRARDAVFAGAAFELLHVSSLVHDDIMDESATRRGRPTVVARYGSSVAILAGDALVALAFRSLQHVNHQHSSEIHQLLSSAFLSLCEGQCADISGESGNIGSIRSHRWMVERKTARLIEACAQAGAVLANAPRPVVQALGTFGLSLGLAYQAMDDLLDAIGTEKETGKSVGLDARHGRTTHLSLAGDRMDRAQQIHAMVEGYTNEACAALDAIPYTPARSQLHEIAHSLVHRRY